MPGALARSPLLKRKSFFSGGWKRLPFFLFFSSSGQCFRFSLSLQNNICAIAYRISKQVWKKIHKHSGHFPNTELLDLNDWQTHINFSSAACCSFLIVGECIGERESKNSMKNSRQPPSSSSSSSSHLFFPVPELFCQGRFLGCATSPNYLGALSGLCCSKHGSGTGGIPPNPQHSHGSAVGDNFGWTPLNFRSFIWVSFVRFPVLLRVAYRGHNVSGAQALDFVFPLFWCFVGGSLLN